MTDVNTRNAKAREYLETKLIQVNDDLDEIRQSEEHPDWKKTQEEAIGTIMAQLTSALGRIEDGTFGMCISCGHPISEGQLASLPHVGECPDCAPLPDVEPKSEEAPKKKTGILERARRRMGLKEDGSEDGVEVEPMSVEELQKKFNEAADEQPGDEWSVPADAGEIVEASVEQRPDDAHPGEAVPASSHTHVISAPDGGGHSMGTEPGGPFEGKGAGADKEFVDDPVPGILAGQVRELRPEQIIPSPDNDRQETDAEDYAEYVKELAASIASVGLLNRLSVRPNGDDTFSIIAGHCRYDAITTHLRWELIPVEVFEFDDARTAAARLIENVKRRDLTPVEEADAMHQLIDKYGYTQQTLAQTIGAKQPTISKRLALRGLTDKARDCLQSNVITLRDAQELLKVKAHPKKLDEILQMHLEYKYDIAGTVKREVDQLDRRAKLDKTKKDLEKDGVTVYGHSKYYQMSGKADLGRRPGQLDVDKKKHAAEPCHAATIDDYSQRVVLFCTDWKRHRAKAGESELKGKLVPQPTGPQLPGLSVEERERRQQLQEAKKLRETFVRDTLLKGRISTGEALRLFAFGLTVDEASNGYSRECYYDADSAKEALGLKRADKLGEWLGDDPDKTAKVLLAETVRNIDFELDVPDKWGPELQPYFDLLEKHGYEIAPIERELLQPKDKKTKGAA